VVNCPNGLAVRNKIVLPTSSGTPLHEGEEVLVFETEGNYALHKEGWSLMRSPSGSQIFLKPILDTSKELLEIDDE